MAINLIIEDGSGVVDANSYITPDYAANYFAMHGSELWEDNCDDHSLALVQASSFFDLRYYARFCGEPLNPAQGLLFPRTVGDFKNGLPRQLKDAVASLALQFMQNDGVLDLNGNQDSAIRSTSVSLGSGAISETTHYFDNSGLKSQFSVFSTTDAHVNQLMKAIGCETGGNMMFIPAWRS